MRNAYHLKRRFLHLSRKNDHAPVIIKYCGNVFGR
jgi:hypothetical protein